MNYSKMAAVLAAAYAGWCLFVADYSGIPVVGVLWGAVAMFWAYIALEAWRM